MIQLKRNSNINIYHKYYVYTLYVTDSKQTNLLLEQFSNKETYIEKCSTLMNNNHE